MILRRKKSTAENPIPEILTRDGVTHPDIILTIISSRQDKKMKTLEISCAYFHSIESFEAGFDVLNNINGFSFNFTNDYSRPADKDSQGNIKRLGFPSYDELMQSVSVDDYGDLVKIADDVEYWILNQWDARDLTGKVFAENWEFVSDTDAAMILENRRNAIADALQAKLAVEASKFEANKDK